ncbi:hypothetical protein [Nitratireductor sp. OM-1]|uniref:hypothetical protein n=1 Tax=Nitratireductor sp. OM-1 TaxID=1756988 RepID=UPI000DDF0065|nr:hypothetical protein [Nitratireductor sp. OM-1]
MTESVRKLILRNIEAAYKSVQPPAPGDPVTDDDWPFAFSSVEIGPLADEDHRRRFSIGIVAGPEKERFTIPFIECNWTVGVEFRATINRGDPRPALVAEDVLTVVKRVVDIDRTWGGLAVDTKRKGNELDLTTYGDKTVVGVMFMEIMFRHSHIDTRDRHPDP